MYYNIVLLVFKYRPLYSSMEDIFNLKYFTMNNALFFYTQFLTTFQFE